MTTCARCDSTIAPALLILGHLGTFVMRMSGALAPVGAVNIYGCLLTGWLVWFFLEAHVTDYFYCPRCGTKIGDMQVHSTDNCERAQRKVGMPPYPLREWPPAPDPLRMLDMVPPGGASS